MKNLLLIAFLIANVYATNQTPDITSILSSVSPIPFKVSIVRADFSLPIGLQAAASGYHGSEYLFIAGRTNGLHGFGNDHNNFSPNKQNTIVFVVNPCKKRVKTRSLHDPASGLTQKQIDSLSVTATQFYQKGNTLYIAGGYGVDTATGEFSTKDTLTAIDIPGLIDWVKHPYKCAQACQYIRQISNPLFQGNRWNYVSNR